MKKLSLSFLLFSFVASAAFAEPRYISDNFEVTLRTCKSGTHQILRMLPSGTKLELLETDTGSGYSLIRGPEGKEGWVITRFLMETKSSREQLLQAQKKITRLEEEKKSLSVETANSIRIRSGAVEEQKRLSGENNKLSLELMEIKHAAANSIAIDKERKQLQAVTIKMRRELDGLHMENIGLKDRTARDWFMVGAGVMLFGIITGLVFSRMRFRKRSEWDSL